MGQSSNPFKNFVNQLVMDPARQRQQMPGFMNIDPTTAQLNDVMKMMDKTWGESEKLAMQNAFIEHQKMAMMEQAFIEGKLHEEAMMQHHLAMEQQWKAQMEHEMMKDWSKEFIQNDVLAAREKVFNEAFDQAKQEVESKEKNNQEATGGLISLMMNDPDPKFQNSKFLDFLKKVNTGEFEVREDNTLIHHPEKAKVELKADIETTMNAAFAQSVKKEEEMGDKITGMETAFRQAELGQDIEEEVFKKMDQAFAQATNEENMKEKVEMQKKLESLWHKMMNEYDENNPQLMEKLNNEWLGMMDDWNNANFDQHWQKAADIDELQYQNFKKDYEFHKDNKYASLNAPHRMFIDLVKAGNIYEAIKALEGHLQKHPKDHEGWIMLGGLLQESDMDQQSVTALMKSLEVEPGCLYALLQVGVGCTNILDEIHSLMYLHKWLQLNPAYAKFAGPELITLDRLNRDDYTSTEILAINKLVLEKFEAARQAGAGETDPEFCMAMGVVAFMAREYKLAVDLMNRTVELDPHSYSAWNKLGACLAQLNETEMARMSYKKALDLKPNYVRPWVNLGLSNGSKVTTILP
jgi:peroxin-5